MAANPLGYTAYRAATAAIAPAIPLFLRSRLTRGKEDATRLHERLARDLSPRPDGTLIWVHGASVGECIAALPVIEGLLNDPALNVLVTSGTMTSARMMQERLPARALHQYIPIDTPSATARFLDHWKPELGLFVDSDIWPNLVLKAKRRGIKLALINARMSERSFKGWRWAPQTARALLSSFDICLAQDDDIARRFRSLGAPDVRTIGSLKADAPPLPANEDKLNALRDSIGRRPILLAAQTHPGEDETILPAHDILRQSFPDLLTILVPRHVARAEEIAQLCGTRTWRRRSEGALPTADTAIYIADTMGELGLFYRLTSFAFIGGSLVRHGGQNPLEPALLNCGVLAGPHVFNFTTAYAAILASQGTGLVHSCTEIVALSRTLLSDPVKARALGAAAAAGAMTLGGAVDTTLAVIKTLLAADARA